MSHVCWFHVGVLCAGRNFSDAAAVHAKPSGDVVLAIASGEHALDEGSIFLIKADAARRGLFVGSWHCP